MGLNKEVLDELIPKILHEKDPESFALFDKEYGAIIKLHASKWLWAINKASLNLYDFEDLENELWEWVISRLCNYDPEKASMTTFLYMVCKQSSERICDFFNRQMRNPGEDIASLNIEIGEEGDTQLLDMIIDPIENIEYRVESETMLFEHLYFLKTFIQSLNHQQQIIYLHMVKGLTLQASGDILCISRERVRQIRNAINQKIMKRLSFIKKIDHVDADTFAITLLSSASDDEISDKLSINLGTVKICREILILTDLYNSKEVTCI